MTNPNPAPGLWLSLRLRNVPAMLTWLRAVGFTELASYEDDSGTLVHAEYLWPHGGGVMLGVEREGTPWPQQAGTQAAYAVTDDVDGLYATALAAGGTVIREPVDQEYGRDASVRDPDGNLWSFGTYAPGG